MIEVNEVNKWYGKVQALKNISFQVPKGEIVGFLGPNGAGKTTMMKILTTFLHPDTGNAKVCDLDVSTHPLEVRKRIGYLPEQTPLYEDMDVTGFLQFVGQARGIPSADLPNHLRTILHTCGLESVKYKSISTLSKGYRQRVGLAQAMIHKPDVLILDEPTSGLDPNQILEVRELIRTVGKERTVMLSTHILSEVEAVCSRVIIIHKGRVVANDSMENLQKQEIKTYSAIIKGEKENIQKSLEKIGLPSATFQEKEGWWQLSIEADKQEDLGEKIFLAVKEAEGALKELHGETSSLEDVFRKLTKTV